MAVGVGGVVDDGRDELVLVGEDAEDGALGDARGLGDLAGRDHLAVLEEQRQHGLDDHRPPLVGRQRLGPASAWRRRRHRRPAYSECGLTHSLGENA